MGCGAVVAANGDSLQQLASPYLSHGYKSETFGISQISVNQSKLTALVSIDTDFTSPTDDAGFHVSAVTALAVESQLAIAGYLKSKGFETKPGELWMKSYQHSYRRPIRYCQNIKLVLVAPLTNEPFILTSFGMEGHSLGNWCWCLKA